MFGSVKCDQNFFFFIFFFFFFGGACLHVIEVGPVRVTSIPLPTYYVWEEGKECRSLPPPPPPPLGDLFALWPERLVQKNPANMHPL